MDNNKEGLSDFKIDIVKKEKKEDKNVKNNDKLISQEELVSLVGEHILPMISRRGGLLISGDDGTFIHCDNVDFLWALNNSVGVLYYAGFACLIDDHWEIFNHKYEEKYANIRIFDDHMEFDEDSEFIGFSKEEMYSLYTFLNERIFGIKEDNNNNKEEENING